jgi:hypothetical protein
MEITQLKFLAKRYAWQKITMCIKIRSKKMLVQRAEEYYFSSARNYYGLDAMLEVIKLKPMLQTVDNAEEQYFCIPQDYKSCGARANGKDKIVAVHTQNKKPPKKLRGFILCRNKFFISVPSLLLQEA